MAVEDFLLTLSRWTQVRETPEAKPSLTKQDCAAGTRIQKIQLGPQTGQVRMSNSVVGKGPICTGPSPKQQSETPKQLSICLAMVSKWLLAQRSKEH